MIIATLALLLTGGLCLAVSEDTQAGSANISGETNVVKTGGELSYDILYYEAAEFSTLEITYTASLLDSGNTAQSSAVTPSSGTLFNGVSQTLKVTAPDTAGKYTLRVVFTETIDGGDATTSTETQTITVVDPVTLSVTLTNNSEVDVSGLALMFYVDGELVEGSRTLLTVAAGESATVTHSWVSESVSGGKHTFMVMAAEDAIIDISGLGEEHAFYVGHSDYGLMNILMGIFLVILIVLAVYVYRKPVKNYGKPKARR